MRQIAYRILVAAIVSFTSIVSSQELVSQQNVQQMVLEQGLLLDSATLESLNEPALGQSGPFLEIPVESQYDFDIGNSPQLRDFEGQLDRKLLLPQLSSRIQFEELFLPRDPGNPINIDNSIMQVVPGVPTEGGFDQPQYNEIREDFSIECQQSAAAYFSKLEELNSLSSFPTGTVDDAVRNLSKMYDDNCLTKVDAVPQSVKRVTGVLSMNARPFCSATIISDRELVTSRHCFFNAYTGAANSYYTGLISSQVTFSPLSADHGVGPLTAKTGREEDTSQTEYAPYADYFRLRVSGGRFTHFAEIERAQSGTNSAEPAWLVGSNALLGDIGSLVSPLQLVRASAPKACAVLRVTEKGCLYHSCQAGSSTSGAGLLAIRAGKPVLLGVHKGHISRADGCEDSPPIGVVLNMAAKVAVSEDDWE